MLSARKQRVCWGVGVVCSLVLCAYSTAQDVVINEIHYDPPDRTHPEEFIELYNAGAGSVGLSGAYFSSGVSFAFPDGAAIGPDQYLIIAEDPDAFEARFGFAADYGPWVGQLAGDGEEVILRDAAGNLLDRVDYAVRFPWPLASGGRGSSMELIHPALDNDLGGSWRASGYSSAEPVPPTYFLAPSATGWHYRRGTSNASSPTSAWRQPGFGEDGTWRVGRTPIGYGDGDDNTVLDDMSGSYSSVYLRRTFTVDDADALPRTIRLRVYVDDGCVVWINGQEAARLHVDGGELAFDDFGQNHEAAWDEVEIDPDDFLVDGENLIAIHALNQSRTSSDFSIDAAILIPGTDADDFAEPSPGLENTIFAANAAPQIRQVMHGPRQPPTGQDFAVTAKVTDPDGVLAVELHYQTVAPGDYVPAYLPLAHSVLLSDPDRDADANPDFENPANWTTLVMVDDGSDVDATAGDSIFSVRIPGQENRTLVRYRITVTDALGESVRVPYADDRSLNFGAFVYDGVPAYTVTTRTVQPAGVPYTYGESVMGSLPTYHLITRAGDLSTCIAYDGSFRIPKSNEGARDRFNWEGAFVYDGQVYDHVRYRLRQANDRYGGSGKRSMRFRFNKGRYLVARDSFGRRYPNPWRTLNTGKLFDNKRVGNFGLTEKLNNVMWNMVGVPSPWMHHFHLRVIDDDDEAPGGTNGQYFGDFWGLFLATEDYDTRFLDTHDLEDGNLYKLKDGIFDGTRVRRHQGADSVTSDVDFQNIRNNLRPERPDSWLHTYVNYDRWYYYHAIVEGVRHYDFRPADSHMKNRAWYFELAGTTSPWGRVWTLPHDSDASWGPNWNSGIDYSKNAIFGGAGKPAFKRDYRSAVREVRDLLWTEEALYDLIDDLAESIAPFVRADRDRWRNAPSAAGSQDFGTMEAKVRDMKRFAFVGWSGSTGPTVPAGGRAQHLDNLTNAEGDRTSIPATPLVGYPGPPGFPVDQLVFVNTRFDDPQGAHTFGAQEWRIGEVTDSDAPAFDPLLPRKYEWTTVWRSGPIDAPLEEIAVPPVVEPGHAYRARLRMMDNTGRWGHWSDPLEFIPSAPLEPLPQQLYLRVTELMYNPPDGSDYEFIELLNTGPSDLDLRGVAIDDGVDFEFAGSAVESLASGEYVLVVRNLEAFASRYVIDDLQIAGEYRNRLDNGGEGVRVVVAGSLLVQDFLFDDIWYPETDGAGRSLEIVDPSAPAATWNDEAAWQASAVDYGTPGLGPTGEPPQGGFRVPSDGNEDGRVDVSDAVWLVRALFVTPPARLPCDGESVNEGGNRLLLDANGDGGVDISDPLHVLNWMFQSGPAPALGTSCVRFEGCTHQCRE